jgi:hypothetical protein
MPMVFCYFIHREKAIKNEKKKKYKKVYGNNNKEKHENAVVGI